MAHEGELSLVEFALESRLISTFNPQKVERL
jgi:hypothetical protein